MQIMLYTDLHSVAQNADSFRSISIRREWPRQTGARQSWANVIWYARDYNANSDVTEILAYTHMCPL